MAKEANTNYQLGFASLYVCLQYFPVLIQEAVGDHRQQWEGGTGRRQGSQREVHQPHHPRRREAHRSSHAGGDIWSHSTYFQRRKRLRSHQLHQQQVVNLIQIMLYIFHMNTRR